MELKVYNTADRKLEKFTPLIPGQVTLYTCGPTVYDYPTVGNWSAYVYWDILVRILRDDDYKVTRVMNLTDVGHLTSDADEGEDKLEKGARREGKTAWEIADFYILDFLAGMDALNMIRPDYIDRATDFIEEQLDLIRTLKAGGYTYETSDGIYFDTARFADYPKFARLDLTAQKAGARVEANPEKRQAWDFALWKFSPNDAKRDMEWLTPDDLLDKPAKQPIMGFPGWHLECSAISMSRLGRTIDIHTGGIDHIPVHHTNEIAESEAATGQKFVNFWLHCNHMKIDGGKISKSLGNGYTLQDLESKGFTPLDFRMFVLQGHYQSEGNFTFANLESARNRLANWRRYATLRHQTTDVTNSGVPILATIGRIRQALNNNLNTPEALSVIDEIFAEIDNTPLTEIDRASLVDLLEVIDSLLGLNLINSTPDITDDQKQKILARTRAREDKNWELSDQIRQELLADDITLDDGKNGTIWHR